jgi:hypothetical protein
MKHGITKRFVDAGGANLTKPSECLRSRRGGNPKGPPSQDIGKDQFDNDRYGETSGVGGNGCKPVCLLKLYRTYTAARYSRYS